MVLMAIVPGTALKGAGGLMEAMVGEGDEEEMVVVEGMEEAGERGQWEELGVWEELVEMVLMQTVPGMVLEAVMETRRRPGRSKAGRGRETVWEIETGRVLKERRSVLKWWAARDGPCRLG